MQLTHIQRQLVLRATDSAASPNEQAAAAGLLFRSLRRQYSDGYTLLTEREGAGNSSSVAAASSRYGAVTMPFGKYHGRPLSEIDAAYLLWLLATPPRIAARSDAPSSGVCSASNTHTKPKPSFIQTQMTRPHPNTHA